MKHFSAEEHARRFKLSNEAYERGLVERARGTLGAISRVTTEDVRLVGEGDDRCLELLFRSAANGQPYGWRVRVWPAPAPDVDVLGYFGMELEESFHGSMHEPGVRDYEPREWWNAD